MRCVNCLFVALFICASVVRGAEPNNHQLSTSEKQLDGKRLFTPKRGIPRSTRLLPHNDAVMNASNAVGILRNHFGKIAGILGRCLPTQPYDAIIVSVYLDVGQG